MKDINKKEIAIVACEVASVIVGGVVARIAITLVKNAIKNSK